ncbi:MAG: BrnT family toxin [Calditrichaeota bacterium]|nr:MAG: BrnT family toxin [Calditrichota bacterium]
MNKPFLNCIGFDWDDGNSEKNWIRHQVSRNESEQVFFNEPLIITDDKKHSQIEKRWYLLGISDTGRLLFIVFTIRKDLIRVISARDMNKKEREEFYAQI